MNTVTKTLAVAALAAVAAPAFTHAAVPASATQNVPGQMNYQGYLADPKTGEAYTDGVYTLQLRIWSSESSTAQASCLWGGKYSVYVKGGYFNIMLGDAGATELTAADGVVPVYKNADLWKALWGTSATDTERFLGVTPEQSEGNKPIDAPFEIAPRQKLLSAPFAFRAQHAQYADAAQDAFSVPGNLTVGKNLKVTGSISGTVAAGAGSSLGPVKTTTTTVNFGNGHTSATPSNRSSLPTSVYDVGQYLYFYSYYSMNFKPTAGSVTFSIPSGYGMNVTGAGSFSSTVPVNTIGGTGKTTLGGSGATLVQGSDVTVQSTGSATVQGENVKVETLSASGNVELLAGADVVLSGSRVLVKQSSVSKKPFKLLGRQTVTIAANSRSGELTVSDTSYKWSVAGWNHASGSSTLAAGNAITGVTFYNGKISVSLAHTQSSAVKVNVWLLGIHPAFVEDVR